MELRDLTNMMLEKRAAGTTKIINKMKRKYVDAMAGTGFPISGRSSEWFSGMDEIRKNSTPKRARTWSRDSNSLMYDGPHKATSEAQSAGIRAYLQALRNGRAMNK